MIIAVNNNKGGVLKTTTVTNLAGVFAQQGKKVLIVDADNQSNVSISFGINPDEFRTSLYDVLVGGVPPEDCIATVQRNGITFDILPSNLDLVSFEFDVIGDSGTYPEPFYLMENTLRYLEKQYDVILVDTPPSLGLMNGNVFTFVDKVIIPYEPEAYAMRSLLAVVSTIQDFKKEYNPNLEILGILFTKVVNNSTLHTAIKQETRKFAHENNIRVFETEIPRTVQFANAVGYDSLPAVFTKKSDKGALYTDLYNEIRKDDE